MTKSKPSVLVFSPTPLLTVTVEQQAGESEPEIHLHAGGQGVWVARMVATLGLPVTLCAPFGDDSGRVLRALVEAEGVSVRGIEAHEPNGAYVHDRRSGERVEIASMPGGELRRHEIDDLYNAALVGGISAGVTILTGSAYPDILPNEVYTRLARNLRSNGCKVVADLSGQTLEAALEGGLDLLKVSHEELIEGGYAKSDKIKDLRAGMEKLQKAGAQSIIVTRAAEPALGTFDGSVYEIASPQLEPSDHRGSGDSFTAGLAVGVARQLEPQDIFRIAAAAGALNVTRHGLGTGQREDILQFEQYITITPLDEPPSKAKD